MAKLPLARVNERHQAIIDSRALLRLPQVLALYPVSKSTWWNGIKKGDYPRPIKLTERIAVWPAAAVFKLIEQAALGSDRPRTSAVQSSTAL
jgi:predicted DNA-binding transcriptional regulator AlpA